MKVTGKKTAAGILFLGSIIDLVHGITRISAEGWSLDKMKGTLAAVAAIIIFLDNTEAPKRRQKGDKRALDQNFPVHKLTSKLAAGFFGGFVGGLLGGLTFGIYYYFHARHPLAFVSALGVILENVGYAVLIGIIIGAFTQLAIYAVRRKWERNRLAAKGFVASLFAGAIGGTLLGLIGGSWFGERPFEPAGFGWIMGCLTLGACSIAFGAILYEHNLNWRSAVKALAVVGGIAVLAGILGAVALHSAGIDFTKPGVSPAGIGALTGLIAGATMGMQIAGTEILYRVLNAGPDKPAQLRKKRTKRRVGKQQS